MSPSEYQQLVELLGQRFTSIDGRFASIDGRFAIIDRHFAAIDRRFALLEERVATGFRDVAGHFDETYRRLERLDHEYVAIAQALRRIEGRAP